MVEPYAVEPYAAEPTGSPKACALPPNSDSHDVLVGWARSRATNGTTHIPRPVVFEAAAAAKSRREWARLVDGVFDTHFEKTMGQLLAILSTGTDVPAALEGQLSESLAARDLLAHDFFRERVREGVSASGRNDLIDELEGYTALFRTTDATIEETIRPARERLGLMDEALADEYRAVYAVVDSIR